MSYSCRICYDDFEDRDDVICPCNCNGDMKYICIDCFKKLTSNTKNSSFREECPTCKGKYLFNTSTISAYQEELVFRKILLSVSTIILVGLIVIMLSFVREIAVLVASILIILLVILYLVSSFPIIALGLLSLFEEIPNTSTFYLSLPICILVLIGFLSLLFYFPIAWNDLLKEELSKIRKMVYDLELQEYTLEFV